MGVECVGEVKLANSVYDVQRSWATCARARSWGFKNPRPVLAAEGHQDPNEDRRYERGDRGHTNDVERDPDGVHPERAGQKQTGRRRATETEDDQQ